LYDLSLAQALKKNVIYFVLFNTLEKNDEAHLSQLLLITFNVANFQLLGTKAQHFRSL
jgi:hypothetical protein